MKKTTTKKSPTGAPLDNPLKFFREGGEKRKAMFKNEGNYGPPPGMGKTTMKSSGVPDPFKVGPYGNTTSGQIYIPEEKNGGMMKKGGATKAKKFARKKK